MLRKLSVPVLLIILAATPAFGQEDWARKMFEETNHDFGSVAHNAKAEFAFVLSNPYMADIHIASVRSNCGCTRPRIAKQVLKTYEEGAIIAAINTQAFTGNKGATVTVTFDKPYHAEVQLHVKANIHRDVVLTPGSVQFDSVDLGKPAEYKICVTHSGRRDWRILDVKSDSPHLAAEVVETSRHGGQVGYDLCVRLHADAPAGYLREHLILVTNDHRGGQIPLAVEGRVCPAVTVSPASLFMGVVEPGKEVTRKLVVRAKKPFRILAITCDGELFEFDDCTGDAKPLHVVPVTFRAGENSGRVAETIRIETDLDATTPELGAYAVVSTP